MPRSAPTRHRSNPSGNASKPAYAARGWLGSTSRSPGCLQNPRNHRNLSRSTPFETASDKAVEYSGDGYDLVRASVTYTLLSNVEALSIEASGSANGTGNIIDNGIFGNEFSNIISGLDGEDRLFGNGGDDELYGGADNDTLYGGTGNDLLDGGAGLDFAAYHVISKNYQGNSISPTQGVTVDLANTGWQNTGGAGTDRLVSIEGVLGTEFADTLSGDGNDNILYGYGGNDTLTGGDGGIDYLLGGAGDDTYVIKSQNPVGLIEEEGEGIDTVISHFSHTLVDNIENLTLVGPYIGVNAITGIGNGLDNVITGNEFNNVLEGRDGDDELKGEDGEDTLHGGSGNDKLLGGDGNDILDGGTGADEMIGGDGNDTYYIDNPGDSATEVVGAGGIDTIYANLSTDLGEAFEVLYLTGTANLNGTGGSQNNALTGNAGDNLLRGLGGDDGIVGGAGNDTLDGGVGDDVLDGGAGVDTAVFTGNRSAYTVTQTATGKFTVTGPDGTDTLSNVEFLKFDDQTIKLYPGTGTTVNFATDNPATYMAAIRDFDGNDVGAASDWKRIGAADVNGDGDLDQIFVNRTNGRFAEVGTAPDGKVYFSDHGWAGETRVVGIYIDPLVQSGQVQAGSDFDSQRRFQNDLKIGNIAGVLGAGDYDKDGLQEVYFKLTDGTAYLHAHMHADGNIRYANYQSQQQVIDFLTQNGWASSTWDGWFG